MLYRTLPVPTGLATSHHLDAAYLASPLVTHVDLGEQYPPGGEQRFLPLQYAPLWGQYCYLVGHCAVPDGWDTPWSYAWVYQQGTFSWYVPASGWQGAPLARLFGMLAAQESSFNKGIFWCLQRYVRARTTIELRFVDGHGATVHFDTEARAATFEQYAPAWFPLTLPLLHSWGVAAQEGSVLRTLHAFFHRRAAGEWFLRDPDHILLVRDAQGLAVDLDADADTPLFAVWHLASHVQQTRTAAPDWRAVPTPITPLYMGTDAY